MIQSQKFKDTRTGDIVTQFDIMDIKYMEKVEVNDYFDLFFEETEKVQPFDFYEEQGEHIFSFNYTKEDILKIIHSLPKSIQEQVKRKFVQIDYKNGDINHFLNYLLTGYCNEQIKQTMQQERV